LGIVDGGNSAYFNRNTSDGEIVRLAKDGTTVGSIGSANSGVNLFIAGTTTCIKITNDNTVSPASTTGSNSDADTDLGASGNRFKDLFLSGSAYADNFVGTNDTNTFIAMTGGDAIRHFTGGTERMRIDSSGNVGIGTSSPKTRLHVTNPVLTSGSNIREIVVEAKADGVNSSFGALTGITFRNHTGDYTAGSLSRASGVYGFNNDTDVFGRSMGLAFYTSTNDAVASERMRLDSSGNLLVGKTSGSNEVAGIELNGTCQLVGTFASGTHILGRNTTDGSILQFNKDNSQVGSIGTFGNDLTVGNNDAGLRFYNGINAITPFNLTTNADLDAATDLGTNTIRFEDLYLSGGVYLGGTGSSNKLDDYEEGTWTPTIASGITSPTYSVQNGTYTKVGRLVTYSLRLTLTAGTAAASILQIGGLPFTVASAPRGMSGSIAYAASSIISTTSTNLPIFEAGAGSSALSFYQTDGNQFLGTNLNAAATFNIDVGGQYLTA